MYLSKDKRQDISNERSNLLRRMDIDISGTGDAVRKGIMAFCKLTELTDVIDSLTELRDIIEKETGIQF